MSKSLVKPVVISTLCVALAALAVFGTLDRKSEQYTGDAFTRALITFGIARGLNGVISVAQGTEVAVHPAGLGVSFTPGQILDPINDLVEQFSWIMLASSASLGIQKVLLTISSTLFVTILFIAILVIYLVSVWKRDLFHPDVGNYLSLTFVILIFIRFSVPVAMLASEGIYRMFLQEQYTQSSQQLEQTREKITVISAEETRKYTTEDEGFVEKAKKFFSSTSQNLSINDQIEKYQQIAAEATKHAINIIVVFLLQTLLVPLLFLWLSYRACKFLWHKVLPA